MSTAVETTAVRSTAVGRLVRIELKLMVREPLTLIFVFVFPVVTMLIIGGSFGTTPTVAFDWVNPSQWYVASYLTVVIAATGLIMVPVHLASYRERGVLRRFAAAGFPRWSFALVRVALGFGLGSVAFVAIGVLLGTVLPSARSAQAVGMVLFFPSFLLGSGGPPPHVMGTALRTIASYLPLTRVTDAVRDPWLGTGTATGSLLVVGGLAVAATLLAARCSSFRSVSR